MATNPFPYASNDIQIKGNCEADGRNEWCQSIKPTLMPVFEILDLEEYANFRARASDLILGATIFTSNRETLFDLLSFEMVDELQPIETKSWVELYRFPEDSTAPTMIRDVRPELRISHADDFAFGHWEADLASEDSVEETTVRAYRSILAALRGIGNFHLWRCWNVIPNIHKRVGDLDHYMQFCLGRHNALVTEGHLSLNMLPAASAVGSRGNRIQITFIAGKEVGATFENPDQISAYSYPRRYGPASPSFSRSLLAGDHLWLSGTASIAGHQSLHAADLSGQVHETASRIKTLAACLQHQRGFDINLPRNLKLFLRHRESASELMPFLKSAFPKETSYYLVEADICRDDLLIEIEGTIT